MKRQSFSAVSSLLLAFAVLALSPDILAAAAEEHHGGNQLADLGWRVFNFIIFAAILYFAGAKPVRNFLDGRIDGIKNELTSAEKKKEDAEKKLQEYLQKLEGLEAELEEIKGTLVREGEVERDRIIEAAHQAAEKIKTQAQFTAGQELSKAIGRIKEEAAEAAVELAEKMLKKDFKKGDQKRLVSEYLDGLGDIN